MQSDTADKGAAAALRVGCRVGGRQREQGRGGKQAADRGRGGFRVQWWRSKTATENRRHCGQGVMTVRRIERIVTTRRPVGVIVAEQMRLAGGRQVPCAMRVVSWLQQPTARFPDRPGRIRSNQRVPDGRPCDTTDSPIACVWRSHRGHPIGFPPPRCSDPCPDSAAFFPARVLLFHVSPDASVKSACGSIPIVHQRNPDANNQDMTCAQRE